MTSVIREKITPHPLAEIFPPMAEGPFGKLKQDIYANGLREPIIIYKGMILDGRGRSRACVELGIEPTFREYEGNDPLGFVISMNVHRRHLNESQRAMIAAKLANPQWGGDRTKPQICGLTHGQAAELLSVSQRQVEYASALLNAQAEGRVVPEIVEAVHNGGMRLHKAAKIASLSLEEQREIVSQKNNDAAQPGRAPNREPWARRLEKTASQAEHLSLQIGQFIARDEIIGKLSPEHRTRLVEGWRCAAQRLTDAAKRLEQIDRPDPKPPVENAAVRLEEMPPQEDPRPVVEDDVDLD